MLIENLASISSGSVEVNNCTFRVFNLIKKVLFGRELLVTAVSLLKEFLKAYIIINLTKIKIPAWPDGPFA